MDVEVFFYGAGLQGGPEKGSDFAGQRRKMIWLALDVVIRAVMQGHMYQLDGKVHLQSEGGPFGLELSGTLARVNILLWDRELLQKLNKATAANTSWDLYAYLR